MTKIHIFVEGGGQTAEGRRKLRQGFDGFLAPIKDLARQKGWGWNLEAAEGRSMAHRDFLKACRQPASETTYNILLIDLEGPLCAPTPKQHLIDHDQWDCEDIPADRIHCMVQCMETWLIADSEVLQTYYGQHFKISAIPISQNLEVVSKDRILSALTEATRPTIKGSYAKIKHASDLLPKTSLDKVQTRCLHAKRLFQALLKILTTQTSAQE